MSRGFYYDARQQIELRNGKTRRVPADEFVAERDSRRERIGGGFGFSRRSKFLEFVHAIALEVRFVARRLGEVTAARTNVEDMAGKRVEPVTA